MAFLRQESSQLPIGPPLLDGQFSQPPPLGGQFSQPPLGGQFSQSPPLDGQFSQPPPLGGQFSQDYVIDDQSQGEMTSAPMGRQRFQKNAAPARKSQRQMTQQRPSRRINKKKTMEHWSSEILSPLVTSGLYSDQYTDLDRAYPIMYP